MKISLNWPSDFVTFTEKNPEEITRRLTASVGEVDELERQGALLEKCVVGKVLTVSRHPNADKLSLCTVQTDEGGKKVVCGGANLREGMCVAFAHTGATVRWHGTEMMTLKKTKIRGEESEGMICAAEELDLQSLFPDTTGRNIIDLGDGSADIGKPLKDHLNLTDTILHIDNHAITHRADLFSHIGFARECVALGLARWCKGGSRSARTFPKTASPIPLINEIPDLVPRYCACTLSITGLGETPAWMKKKLEATGWRSVSLPVDITNYVTMELGMPLHSFDAGDLKGEVHFRESRVGEHIKTLDGIERELPAGAIVLSDDLGIFDLLGIMGGLRSSTKESTRTIYLHSAAVDPVRIRRAIIATGHRTDAGTIYEKGIPRVVVEQGFLRALELMLELIPGARLTSKMETWGDDGSAKAITLEPARLNRMLGVEIPAPDVKKIFTNLGFEINEKRKTKNQSTLSVTPPLWRLGDIRGEHDLIEEIGRIYGYDQIPTTLPLASIQPPKRDTRRDSVRDQLKEEGYYELIPLSLLGPSLLKKCAIDPKATIGIQNALGEELSLLQPTTLPSLLEHAEANKLEAGPMLRTFTIAHVFPAGKEEYAELGMLCTRMHTPHESKGLLGDPLLILKQDLMHALKLLGHDLETKKLNDIPAYAHPGRSAELLIDAKPIGMLLEPQPSVRARFSLPDRTAVLLLDFTALLALKTPEKIFQQLPQFPAISYDVTVKRSQKEQTGPLLHALKKHSTLLQDVQVADLYTGKPLAHGDYNLTLRLTYRAPDRTLTEEEAQREHQKVMKALETTIV